MRSKNVAPITVLSESKFVLDSVAQPNIFALSFLFFPSPRLRRVCETICISPRPHCGAVGAWGFSVDGESCVVSQGCRLLTTPKYRKGR